MKRFHRLLLLLITLALWAWPVPAGADNRYLTRGWEELAKDNDAAALRYFGRALDQATQENDTAGKALSFLYLGIGSYGTSYPKGLEYAMRALAEYRKLEHLHPAQALEGRSRSLQLVSTIYGRQRRYREALLLSREALSGFTGADSTGTLGLIFSSIANAYRHLGPADSVAFYYEKALEAQKQSQHLLYLPAAYVNVAGQELADGNRNRSKSLYDTAMEIAITTGNRQAQVVAWLGQAKWQLAAGKTNRADSACRNALQLAAGLTDKTFRLRALEGRLDICKEQADFRQALALQTAINDVKDSIALVDKERTIESLAVQFQLSEKDRQLQMLQQERKIGRLTAYLMWGFVGVTIIILTGIIWTLRRMAKKDRLLLVRKDELLQAEELLRRTQEQQHQLAAARMVSELEHKESQLSALTMQMLQKNELLQDLKQTLEKEKTPTRDNEIGKLLNKGLGQDKDWADFNRYFESINKNFYARLKQLYEDIGPNDLKICALIKMNLSSKEMAGILNISPDSVKTARYRLRKKLKLNTEDNLTDFILKL